MAAHQVSIFRGDTITLLYKGKRSLFPSRYISRCKVCGVATDGLVWFGPEPKWSAEPVCDGDFLWAKRLGVVV